MCGGNGVGSGSAGEPHNGHGRNGRTLTEGPDSPQSSPHLAPRAEGLVRNSAFVALSKATLGLLFLVQILAARVLGVEAFGRFTLGFTVATLLLMLPAWGSNRYTLIMASRDPGRMNHLISDNLGLTALLSGPYLVAVALVAYALAVSR